MSSSILKRPPKYACLPSDRAHTVFPFGKVRIPQVIFFVLYIEVSLQLHSQRTRAPELRGVPLEGGAPNAPLWGRRGQGDVQDNLLPV